MALLPRHAPLFVSRIGFPGGAGTGESGLLSRPLIPLRLLVLLALILFEPPPERFLAVQKFRPGQLDLLLQQFPLPLQFAFP